MRINKIILMFMLLPISLFAVSSNVPIKANLIKDVIYEYQGKNIMDSEQLIIYQDKVFIPVATVKQLINKEITYADQKLLIQNKVSQESDKDVEEIKVMGYGVIQEINLDKQEIIVVPQKTNEQVVKEIKYNLLDSTQVIDIQTKTTIPKSKLKKGMVVAIEYREKVGLLKTIKLEATKIALLTRKVEEIVEQSIINDSYISTINKEEGYIDVELQNKNNIRVYMDCNTIIRDIDGNLYVFEDLELSYRVKVVTNGIFTNSNPKETVGLEVVLLEK